MEENDISEEESERIKKFKEKQKKAYANEFIKAKEFGKELELQDEEILKETMENTKFNKYVGKITKDKNI